MRPVIWILTLVVHLKVLPSIASLQCWKCVADDCSSDLHNNYKATKMQCNAGEDCMKVVYMMDDNETNVYTSITRSCSRGKCVASSEADYQTCLNTPRMYHVKGCSLRKCCNSEDMCNHSPRLDEEIIVYIGTIFVLYQLL